ncbi:hypothetical protein GIB67_014299 [Kingdonia uniflora]|uniref:BHLH domain-containing protein n=1 Tax=Kingdonia uniflora TaxID=39325 RepID=A0A7J7NT84_9MAGN|nr:hypothetical protein GIB67_038162 [Kingdonia uniflora]KAF6170369.1 hypothetical protein GIB67_014299 [Kingdonia uniflora]
MADNTNKKRRSSKGGGGVKLSTDPQSVAARERRHRISDRFKILQSMVPGGTKMDTVSMLEEAIQYVKFLKTQIWLHQTMMLMNEDEVLDDDLLFPSQPFGESQVQERYNLPFETTTTTTTFPQQDGNFQVDHDCMFSSMSINF